LREVEREGTTGVSTGREGEGRRRRETWRSIMRERLVIMIH
jgi:hypothetical protein